MGVPIFSKLQELWDKRKARQPLDEAAFNNALAKDIWQGSADHGQGPEFLVQYMTDEREDELEAAEELEPARPTELNQYLAADESFDLMPFTEEQKLKLLETPIPELEVTLKPEVMDQLQRIEDYLAHVDWMLRDPLRFKQPSNE